ncbi:MULTISPECIES: Arc family DNA-binding protein [unclassified Acinetobacter]|uniref:Arc family DNA-binding protein n=1 Tax=unclassified Acinetobacter TaxID=196816 RepID=UPI0015D19546|nr:MULTISPECIES: Arc family DNA-binding protein [unclassified Acinetobacter]
MSKSGGNLTTQYNLRWSDELKEKIAQSAKEHNRSMNADIVARLEQSFLITDGVMTDQELLAMRNEIQELKKLIMESIKKAP